MLAGDGGSSSITKALLSSGQRQSNDHRVDPTRLLPPGAAHPGSSEARDEMRAGGASSLLPAVPPMLAELCRAGMRPKSLRPGDHADQGSSMYCSLEILSRELTIVPASERAGAEIADAMFLPAWQPRGPTAGQGAASGGAGAVGQDTCPWRVSLRREPQQQLLLGQQES